MFSLNEARYQNYSLCGPTSCIAYPLIHVYGIILTEVARKSDFMLFTRLARTLTRFYCFKCSYASRPKLNSFIVMDIYHFHFCL